MPPSRPNLSLAGVRGVQSGLLWDPLAMGAFFDASTFVVELFCFSNGKLYFGDPIFKVDFKGNQSVTLFLGSTNEFINFFSI